jgi:hypothetical protein
MHTLSYAPLTVDQKSFFFSVLLLEKATTSKQRFLDATAKTECSPESAAIKVRTAQTSSFNKKTKSVDTALLLSHFV